MVSKQNGKNEPKKSNHNWNNSHSHKHWTEVEGKQCMKNWEICTWSESQIYIWLGKKNEWKWRRSTRAEKVMQQEWWLTSYKNFKVWKCIREAKSSFPQHRPEHIEARQLSTEEHDENQCCHYTAGLNKLGGNISQSEISNIATDCKSDNKK